MAPPFLCSNGHTRRRILFKVQQLFLLAVFNTTSFADMANNKRRHCAPRRIIECKRSGAARLLDPCFLSVCAPACLCMFAHTLVHAGFDGMRSISLSRLQEVVSISARQTDLVFRKSRRKQTSGDDLTFSLESDDILDGPGWLDIFQYDTMQMPMREREPRIFIRARRKVLVSLKKKSEEKLRGCRITKGSLSAAGSLLRCVTSQLQIW